jgi:hypothetical protein
LNGTRFLICCRGHHVQTSLSVTRVVLVLVILRHCHAPLPDDSIQTANVSRIIEKSLFKMEHSQKGPLTWKWANTLCRRPRRDRPRPGWRANTQSREESSPTVLTNPITTTLRSVLRVCSGRPDTDHVSGDLRQERTPTDRAVAGSQELYGICPAGLVVVRKVRRTASPPCNAFLSVYVLNSVAVRRYESRKTEDKTDGLDNASAS